MTGHLYPTSGDQTVLCKAIADLCGPPEHGKSWDANIVSVTDPKGVEKAVKRKGYLQVRNTHRDRPPGAPAKHLSHHLPHLVPRLPHLPHLPSYSYAHSYRCAIMHTAIRMHLPAWLRCS